MISRLLIEIGATACCDVFMTNVIKTIITKTGNKIFDKFIIGTGGLIVGSLVTDKAVNALMDRIPDENDINKMADDIIKVLEEKEKLKEVANNGRSEKE